MYLNELSFSAFIFAPTLAVVSRASPSPSQNWAGWLQTVDFASVVTDAGREPVFRVTQVEVEPGDWNTGLAHLDIELPNDLVENYFVMCQSVRDDLSAASSPNTISIRVTQDPFGTGDLATSSAANVLRVEYNTYAGSASAVITVVESLRAHGTSGFRLRDIVECSGTASGDLGVDTQLFDLNAGVEIGNRDRVAVFAGPRGGGATTAATGTGDWPTVYVAGRMQDDDTIALLRYQSTAMQAYTATAYVVEWGTEWTVGQTLYIGDSVTTWTTFDLDKPVVAGQTWAHAFVGAYDNEMNDGPESVAVVLGDGSGAPNSLLTYTSASVRLGVDESALVLLYTFSHASLSAGWAAVTMTSLQLSNSLTVAAPLRGESYGDTASGLPFTLGYRQAQVWTWTNETATGYHTASTPFARVTGDTTTTVSRTQHNTNNIEGYAITLDFGGIESRTDGGAFDEDYGGGGPIQGLVVRDRWLDSATLSSATEGGVYPGPVVPASENYGSGYGFAFGTPDVSSTADWVAGSAKQVEVKVVSGGALNGQAGLARRRAGDPDAAWAGTNAYNVFLHQASQEQNDHHQSTACYVASLNRIIRIRTTGTTQLNYSYISLNEQPGNESNWTSAALIGFSEFDNSYDSGMDVVELPDGSLYMIVQTDKGSGTYDADAYISSDGGLSWTRVHQNLRTLVTGSTGVERSSYRLSASGDFLRLVMAVDSFSQAIPATMDYECWVSPDRGASWTKLTSITGKAPPGGAFTSTGAGMWPMDMCGLGDQAGTCLLLVGNDNKLEVYIASGLDDWTAYSGLDIDYNSVSVGDPYAVWLVRDPDRLWIYTIVSDGSTTSELHGYTVDPSDITDSSNWTEWGRLADFPDGEQNHMPYHTRGFWFGEGIALYGALADVSSVGSGVDNTVPGACFMFSGRYDRQPWCTTDGSLFSSPTNYLSAKIATMTYAWWSWMGEPNDASGSSWTRPSLAAVFSDRADYQAAVCNGSTEYGYWTRNDGTPISTARLYNGAIHFRTRVTEVMTGVDLTTTHAGAQFVVYSTTNNGVNFTIRMTDQGWALYDNVSATTHYTASFGVVGAEVEWRIAFSGVDTVEVRWREVIGGKNDAAWTSSGEHLLGTQNNATESISFGIISASGVASGQTTFRWSELVEYRSDDLGQLSSAVSLPEDLMGAPMTPGGVHLLNGLGAKFGGSGTFSSDNFTATLDYTRGVQNLLLDSPQMMWEGLDTSSEAIVFQAGTTLTDPRWEIDAVLFVGTVDRTLVIQFSDEDSTAAWASPAEAVEVSADLYADLTVVDVNGSAVKVESASGVLPGPGEVDGLFIRFLPSKATFRVRQSEDIANGWLQIDAEADGEVYLGSASVIYADRMLYRGASVHRYRYFRAVFPDVNTGVGTVTDVDGSREAGTATGTHRLGSVVPGKWIPFDVPLEWTWTDNEQPNTTLNRTKGGVSWGVREGEEQRTITARVVGDVNEFRRHLRRTLASHADFNRAPTGLVLNGKDLTRDSLLLVRWESGSQQDEAGWYQDSNGNWRTAGDVSIVCTEVV